MSGSGGDRFMARALKLAARGRGTTHPNPMVGAVIVKGGKVVGEGWHRRPGEAHAELLAIQDAGRDARGATLYVTLEPCAHHGRTPPCTEAILQAGIVKVVASSEDPHRLVAGKGFKVLEKAGVELIIGEGYEKARELNRAFFHFIREGTPYVTLKLASSLDGRIAAPDGSSKWITGERARMSVHRMRAGANAVLVGVGTVIADDPLLTARGAGRKVQPYRIVLDPHLQTPVGSRIVQAAGDGRTVLAAADDLPQARYEGMERLGVRIMKLPAVGRRFKWGDFAGALIAEDILHLMVEGGSATAAWFLRAGAVNRLELFLAPRLLGGAGVPSIGDIGITSLLQAPAWSLRGCRRVGDDVHLTADAPQAPPRSLRENPGITPTA
ncbi:MAG: bifunctional diaminohydroxyphosphoribosylaminopyrimidine deaminase/5-amino-6-(5-phosphoribosylamino)uracil reductase RibD [bacterium]|nr:bifunctional diaminohydroxyphosphoribosylaminopyrimidine deaminase/5-amino-6-(5-phosphoribosylamino)uracil reductase RibD [bacterium]